MKNNLFLVREKLVQLIRNHFETNGFQEIISPVLSHGVPLEPNVHAFSTVWHYPAGEKELYLSTSPENNLKKILAMGAEQQSHELSKLFAVGHSFRNREPADEDHNPEFLMLEWYRSDADYRDLITDMRNLILEVVREMQNYLGRPSGKTLVYKGQKINLEQDWPVFSLNELFEEYAGHSIKELLSLKQLKKTAADFGFKTENSNWEQLFNQIFVSEIEPELPLTPFFIIDYPAKTSPMCRPKKDKPHLAERFEFYLAGSELANGNTEQTDPEATRVHFEKIRSQRLQNDLPVPKIDPDFISALEKLHQTGRTYAGVGLGVERLAMILADTPRLNQVNPFVL